MRQEQGFEPRSPCRVVAANLVQVLGTGGRIREVEHNQKDLTFGDRVPLGRTRTRGGRPVPGFYLGGVLRTMRRRGEITPRLFYFSGLAAVSASSRCSQ